MSVLVVINPIAGPRSGRTAAARMKLAADVLTRTGMKAEVRLTERAGHAEELARQAAVDGYEMVVAWGGDGTVNEVSSALAFTGTSLAIVPAGSGNGLARALGIPRDPARALSYALKHPGRRIDVGSIGGRFFANVAGIGLDAEVAWRFNRGGGGRRGPLRYVPIAFRCGLFYRAIDYRLTLDDEHLEERALIVAIANSSQYGNGAIVAPDAVPDDGLLDVVVVGDRSIAGRMLGARRLLSGTLLTAPGVVHRRVRRMLVEAEAPIKFHVDGDPMIEEGAALVAVVHPGALKVMA